MVGGTVVGTLVGAIPGAGATIAAMVSYQQAQMISKHPERFGKGSIEGIGANEAAQNASNSGELIPTLGLGLPVSGSMVLLLSALTVQGFVPGPLMVARAPELLYATIAGMLASTVFLLVVGWQMATLMLKAVLINRQLVIVLALAMTILGTYALQNRVLDVAIAFVFGIIGYFMMRYGYSVAAAALAVFLGREFERNLRIGLQFYDQSWYEFFSRPITAAIMTVVFALLVYGIVQQIRMRRRIKANLARRQPRDCRSEGDRASGSASRASAARPDRSPPTCVATTVRRRRRRRRRGRNPSLPITSTPGLPRGSARHSASSSTAKPRCASVATATASRSASRARSGQPSMRARFPSTSVTP